MESLARRSIGKTDKNEMWEKVDEAWEKEEEKVSIAEREEDEETVMVGESERERIFEEVKLRNLRGMRVEEIVQQGYVMGEGGKKEVIPFPKRVFKCKEFWRTDMHASEEEMRFIEEGYFPEFIDGKEPEPHVWIPEKDEGRHEVALGFVTLGIVREVKREDLHIISETFILKEMDEEGNEKERFIWDGTHINKSVPDRHFKVDTAEVVRGIARPGSWGTHNDMEKAFYHMSLNDKAKKYFGYATRDKEGVVHYWAFESPPMGYKNTPFIFHKFTRPVTRYVRGLSILMSLFCDDGFHLCHGGIERCREEAMVIKDTYEKAGITYSVKKSYWEPRKVIEHIGYVWDFTENVIRITPRRLRKVEIALRKLSGEVGEMVTHKELAKGAGCVISTKLVTGNIVRVLTRAIYDVVTPEDHRSWGKRTGITERIKREVELLVELFSKVGGLCVPLVPKLIKPRSFLLSDASESGSGMYLAMLKGVQVDIVTAAPLREGLTKEDSSTLREMTGGLDGLNQMGKQVEYSRCGIGFDNKGAVSAFQIGSSVVELQECAIEFLLAQRELGVESWVFWIPRGVNVVADAGSKDVDHNDYQISRRAWERVTSKLLGEKYQRGELVDAFGSPWDEVREVMKRFWARYFYRDCEGVDAFLQDWGGEGRERRILWMFPPIPLIPQVIEKLRREGGTGLVVVPIWKNRLYMPLLFDKSGHSFEDVRGWEFLDVGDLKLGRQGRPWFITRNERKRRSGFVVLLLGKGVRVSPPLCLQIFFTGKCTLCRGGGIEVSMV